jgi:glycosyltransferase involved in cell wall biosynthesis
MNRFNRERPLISVVVVIYNMSREAPRTLYTLTAGYQGVPADIYEVIVIDDGSDIPFGNEAVCEFGDNFTYLYLDNAEGSPAAALNLGAGLARGKIFGFMIDGARMLSPGIIRYTILANRSFHHPLVSTLGFHLGPKFQPQSITEGYNQEEEDRLLDTVNWRENGYELTTIAGYS